MGGHLPHATGPARLIAAALVLLSAAPALAEEGHGAGWATLGFQALNLGILLWAIVHFGRRPMQRALTQRADAVSKDVDEAQRLHADARAMLDDYEAKIGQLEAEARDLYETFRKEGEAEKARLIEEARADADRIRREAERTVAHEIARARHRLESEVAHLAIAAAEKAIVEKTTPADHRRLTADYLSRLEESSTGA